MSHKGRIIIGWLLISIALGISAFSNYNCSFGCMGTYSKVDNPLTLLGVMSYIIGTFLILSKGDKN